MILFDNRVGVKIDNESLNLLESIAEFTMQCSKFSARNIELLLVSNDEICALNAEFLGKDYATDVLSFPLDSSGISMDLKSDIAKANKELPTNSSIVSEKSGLCSHEQGNKTDSSIDEASGKLHDLSPQDEFGLDFMILGSIVIAYEIADSVAKAQNHSLQTELAILFTHGLLHLLGYDHESDNGEHRKKECEILAHFGIKSTLISRNV